MGEESQVNQTGNQGAGDQGASLGWRAGLPDDLKNHEAIVPYKTVGDFGKAHIETLGKVKEFEGKVANMIPKLSEKATDEERANFFKALGRPDKPEDYGLLELAKADGVEGDPKMATWAQNLFHSLGLSKSQATTIGKQWNTFLVGVVEEEDRLAQEEAKEAEKEFKKGFKSEDEFNTAKEVSKRYWKKLTGVDFDQYCAASGHPDAIMMKFIYENAKKTGEDTLIPGSQGGTGEVKPGMVYDKTKFPKQQKFL